MRALVFLAIAACERAGPAPWIEHHSHKHAPVDPRLYVAIVVPRDTKNIGGPVLIDIDPPGLDGPAFAAKLRVQNQHGVVPEPESDGRGLHVNMKSQPGQEYPYSFQIWYRTITGPGGPIGISCYNDERDAEPGVIELTKATCDGIQLVDDGIYVPLSIDHHRVFFTDHNIVNLGLRIADQDAPGSIEKALDVPKEKRVIDRRQLTDGWSLLVWTEYLTNHEFQAKVRRTIGGHDVYCDADAKVEDKAREQYEWCLALEAP